MTRQRVHGTFDQEYRFSATQNNGKTTQSKDRIANQEVTYTYDALGRLTAARTTDPSHWGLSWAYDGFGIRLSQAVTQGSAPVSNLLVDAATNRISTSGFGYDANGNLTLQPSNITMAYDVENRLTSYNVQISYGYAPDNKRVWTSGPPEVVYFYGPNGEATGTYQVVVNAGVLSLTTRDTSLDFAGVALQRQSKTVLVDRLSSVRQWGSTGSNYFPYGEEQVTTAQGRAKFGLDFFGARYFSAAQGRFTSPDNPKFSEKTDPQTWNLYAYTGNNPLSRIDPLGRNWFYVNGSWSWHQGADVNDNGDPCKRGSRGCHHSDYTHLLVFTATSQDRRTKAVSGTVTLYGNNGGFVASNVIASGTAFSGGSEGRPAIQPGNYEINLNRHGGLESNHMISNLDPRMQPFHNGIQDVGIIDIGQGATADFRPDWGTQRAHLIPLQGQLNDYYFHGKWLYFERGQTTTHGCVCDPYQKVLGKLFELNPNGVGEGAKNGRVAVSIQNTR